jgi:hypothetical protein
MTKEEVREIIKKNHFVKDRLNAVKVAKWFVTGYVSYRVGDMVNKYGKKYIQLSANKGEYHYAYFVEVEE